MLISKPLEVVVMFLVAFEKDERKLADGLRVEWMRITKLEKSQQIFENQPKYYSLTWSLTLSMLSSQSCFWPMKSSFMTFLEAASSFNASLWCRVRLHHLLVITFTSTTPFFFWKKFRTIEKQ